MNHHLNDHKDHPNHHKNNQSWAMKRMMPLWIWRKVNGVEITTWLEFPNAGKATVEDIIGSEERKNSKWAGLWES